MANYSKFLSLINGRPQTVDLSQSSATLELGGELQFDGSTSGHVVINASATTSTYSLVLPAAQAASAGYVLANDGTGVLSWASPSSGSVTSVALALPASVFSVSGSPVTSTGTLTGSLVTQSANTVWAGPTSGSAATPTFRSLVAADIPSLSAIYLPLAGGTMSGAINMGGNQINDLADPVASQDAATKSFVEAQVAVVADSAITALTGDGTATGPGSVAFTLATVNSNVGSFGSSTSIPSFTVNAKGLITAASGNAVVAPAGTLSGTTLNSTVVSSSLTSVGTISSGVWNGTAVAIAYGGTGQSTKQSAFDALSPLGSAGDTLYYNGSHNVALSIGSTGQVLTVVGGEPAWASPATSGTVTSVALADGSSSPIYSISGSPVTSSGTLTFTLNTQSANTVFAAPNGSSGQPTFRSLVSADIPSLSSIYLALTGGTMSGAINMGGNQINDVASPSVSTDAANKGYVDAAIAGLTWKGPAQAYANSNVPLTGSTPLVVDGYTVLDGDLLLLGNQTTASQNGEYAAAITGPTYVLTANGLPNAIGDAWLVTKGTVYADSAFVATAAVPAAAFIEFAGPTSYIFNAPLTLTGNTVGITQATTSTNGYLTSTDWNTFNNKQPAGSYITALTGDVTASGPGSAAATLATVNSNVGSFGSSTSIPNFTVNAKGLLTAAGSNVVVAPAGTLSGTTLNSSVVSSSLTSVGTISSGVWNGTAIGPTFGGTGLTSYATGDTLYASASNTLSKLSIGSTGQVLTVSGGVPVWATPSISPSSIALTQNHVLVGNASNLAADVAMSGDVAIVASGATTIQAGAVTASKLGTVTDGVTTDQSGAGGTIEVKAAGVSATQLATGAFDQVTITGGAGTPASVAQAPSLKRTLVAGQSFSANTSYAVRWGLTANGETANRVYAADITTSSFDLFYVIGMASSGTSVTAGQSIAVTGLGSFNLSSSDSAFASSTDGAPVFLTASGTFSTTAPSSSGQAITRIGIVQVRSATVTSNIIDVDPVFVAVN